MRQIILDTETTGLDPHQGHRLIEIGCVEMINRRITRKTFHYYLNPQRLVDEGAFAVHGLSDAFLADKPLFSDIVEEFLAFIQDAELIIHNATFDLGFLNYELSLLKQKTSIVSLDAYCRVFDTLMLARRKHPGQRNSLDALCKRYQIDNTHRTLHGALLDAEILADVYLAMTGGQASFILHQQTTEEDRVLNVTQPLLQNRSPLLILAANAEEIAMHQQRLQTISSVAVW